MSLIARRVARRREGQAAVVDPDMLLLFWLYLSLVVLMAVAIGVVAALGW